MKAANSPSEKVLSALLDIFLPLIYLTDLITMKTKSGRTMTGLRAYPTFLNPAFSSRRIAFWTAWKGVGDAFTNCTKREAASGTALLIIVISWGTNTTPRGRVQLKCAS